MSGVPFIDLDVNYDPQIFLGVPRQYPLGDLEDPQDWADETTDQMVESGVLPLPDRDYLTALLELRGRQALDLAEDGIITYLHFPRVDQAPMFVWLEVLEAPSSLRELVSADDPQAMRDPVVEAFSTPSLGAGLRALRVVGRGNGLTANLEHGFVVGDVAIKVSAFTDDVARLVSAVPDLDAFVASITVDPGERV